MIEPPETSNSRIFSLCGNEMILTNNNGVMFGDSSKYVIIDINFEANWMVYYLTDLYTDFHESFYGIFII